MAEPRQTPLRQLLKKPEARQRVGRAVVSLLSVGLVSIAAIGALLIWHAIRRGRLIQERLDPPRHVVLPDLPESNTPPPDPHA